MTIFVIVAVERAIVSVIHIGTVDVCGSISISALTYLLAKKFRVKFYTRVVPSMDIEFAVSANQRAATKTKMLLRSQCFCSSARLLISS